MNTLGRKLLIAGLLGVAGACGVWDSQAHAQVPVRRGPVRYYRPSRDYYFGSSVGPVLPTPNSSYFNRDYLNRPLPRNGSGFVRDWSTGRNVPYGKPWLRPVRH